MTTESSPHRLAVYADYVCPFCFLGYVALDRYRSGRTSPLDVEWRPFDLRAGRRRADGSLDQRVDDGKDEEYFTEVTRNVRRLADRYDVEMARDVARSIDSFPAQRVALRLQSTCPDRFESFHRGVFDALWVEDRDVSDADVLLDVAAAAGIDEAQVTNTLEDDDTAGALEHAFERARTAGISGVPTFVSGEHAARGVIPPEQLKRLIEE